LQINIHSKQKNTIQKGSLDKRSVWIITMESTLKKDKDWKCPLSALRQWWLNTNTHLYKKENTNNILSTSSEPTQKTWIIGQST
jgi:hypothetical protein